MDTPSRARTWRRERETRIWGMCRDSFPRRLDCAQVQTTSCDMQLPNGQLGRMAYLDCARRLPPSEQACLIPAEAGPAGQARPLAGRATQAHARGSRGLFTAPEASRLFSESWNRVHVCRKYRRALASRPSAWRCRTTSLPNHSRDSATRAPPVPAIVESPIGADLMRSASRN